MEHIKQIKQNIILKNEKMFITFNILVTGVFGGEVSTVEEGQPDHRGQRSKQQEVTFNAHSLCQTLC